MQKRKHNDIILNQYKEQGEMCLYCNDKTPFEFITRDHFRPVSKGNSFVNNKVFACTTCNSEKQDMDIYEYNHITFLEIRKILRKMVANKWMLSHRQYLRFQYLTKRFVTTNKIIQNGGVPKTIFT